MSDGNLLSTHSLKSLFLPILLIFAISLPGIACASISSEPSHVDQGQVAEHNLPARPHQVDLEDHRLELLMSYTVFHIGLYMSLTAALIAALELKQAAFPKVTVNGAICLFLVAGACGGIIAINVAEFDANTHPVSEFYGDYPLSLLWRPWPFLKYRYLEHTEHTLFWIGTIWLAGSFIWLQLKRYKAERLAVKEGHSK
jgi:hypothetical protein